MQIREEIADLRFAEATRRFVRKHCSRQAIRHVRRVRLLLERPSTEKTPSSASAMNAGRSYRQRREAVVVVACQRAMS